MDGNLSRDISTVWICALCAFRKKLTSIRLTRPMRGKYLRDDPRGGTMLGFTKLERAGLWVAAGTIAVGTGWFIGDLSVGGPLTRPKVPVPQIDSEPPPVLGRLVLTTPPAPDPPASSASAPSAERAPEPPPPLQRQAVTPTSNGRPLEANSEPPESAGQGGGDDQGPPAIPETSVRATVSAAPSSGRATAPPEETSSVASTTSPERTRAERARDRDSVSPGRSVRQERSRSRQGR